MYNHKQIEGNERSKTHYISATIKKACDNVSRIKATYSQILSVYGFAVVNSIFLKSKTNIVANMIMSSITRINIKSRTYINHKLILKAKTNISIRSLTTLRSRLNLKMIMRLGAISKTWLRVGKYTALKWLDPLTLGTLDSNSLGYIDRVYGDGLELKSYVHINTKSQTSIETLFAVSSYAARTLGYYDSFTIGSMDSVTLGNLDKQIV